MAKTVALLLTAIISKNKKTNVKFADVAGLDEEKGELIEIVDFLKKPDKYQEMGAKIPRGILLYGIALSINHDNIVLSLPPLKDI